MRRISFSLTREQFEAGIKTVTRRFGWSFLRPGALLLAVNKNRGLRKGEKVKELAVIQVVTAERMPLDSITQEDVVAEGFPDWTPEEFVEYFCRVTKCKPGTEVTRIEFRRIFTRKEADDLVAEYRKWEAGEADNDLDAAPTQ